MTALACVIGGVLAAAAGARVGVGFIDGEYESPIGLVRISGDGGGVTRPREGEDVMRLVVRCARPPLDTGRSRAPERA